MKEEFVIKVNELVHIISAVLEQNLEATKPSPFTRRWWTKELSDLKKSQNRPSNKAFKLCHLCDHPIHKEYKTAVNKFSKVMHKTCSQDWTDWLESAMQKDLCIANKHITNEPSDYSNACIPTLWTNTNRLPDLAEDNISKAEALALSFFLPPPAVSHVPSNQVYPLHLKGIRFFSWARIHQVIHSLSPYKAPGPDKIPNIVLMKCVEALIDHLFYIYRAVLELNVYHPRWLELLTLVLQK
jgi:hypothetical protein